MAAKLSSIWCNFCEIASCHFPDTFCHRWQGAFKQSFNARFKMHVKRIKIYHQIKQNVCLHFCSWNLAPSSSKRPNISFEHCPISFSEMLMTSASVAPVKMGRAVFECSSQASYAVHCSFSWWLKSRQIGPARLLKDVWRSKQTLHATAPPLEAVVEVVWGVAFSRKDSFTFLRISVAK